MRFVHVRIKFCVRCALVNNFKIEIFDSNKLFNLVIFNMQE